MEGGPRALCVEQAARPLGPTPSLMRECLCLCVCFDVDNDELIVERHDWLAKGEGVHGRGASQ